MIVDIENLSHLTLLEELWINNNKIPNLRQMDTELSHLKNMNTVYLEGNPAQIAEGSAYRRKIMLALPQLKQIDAKSVNGLQDLEWLLNNNL